jgi:hypothetical protein
VALRGVKGLQQVLLQGGKGGRIHRVSAGKNEGL